MNQRRSSGKLLASLSVCLLLVGIALATVYYQVPLRDWVRVQQFQPAAAVVALASEAGMNDHGRYMFYTGAPTLETASAFNAACGDHEHSTATLGCYTGERIYLYDIDNAELHGVEQVTAAHEMLHAAYDRLSTDEKRRVNSAIARYLPTLQADQQFVERMSVYDKLSEADRLNELHSILGTEVKQLSPELEAHYRQYFADRSVVTGLYATYSGVFATLKARADTLVGEYERLVTERNQRVSASNAEYEQLQRDMKAFEQGPRTDAALAARLNARASSFNARLSEVKSRVAVIDARLIAIKAELEGIEVHTKALSDSLDSSLAAPAGGV